MFVHIQVTEWPETTIIKDSNHSGHNGKTNQLLSEFGMSLVECKNT